MCNKPVIKNYACVCQEVVHVHGSHGCMHVIVVRAPSLYACVCVRARAQTREYPQHARHTHAKGKDVERL